MNINLACAITMLVALILAAILVIWGNRFEKFQSKNNKFYFGFLIIVFTAIIISSFDMLYHPPKSTNLMSLLLFFLKNKWIVFFFTTFIKIILVYWAFHFITGLFDRKRIIKIVAKVFGIEFSQELTQDDAEIAKKGYERLEKQFNVIVSLNRETAGYISSKFEYELMTTDSPDKISDNFRDKIRKILVTAYANIQDININVIPADNNEIRKLDDKIASIVEITWKDRDVVEINQRVGVVAYSEIPGLETIIVLDPTSGDYEISDAEIHSVSVLLASIASIISWASQVILAPSKK
jgi:hypothetical protein